MKRIIRILAGLSVAVALVAQEPRFAARSRLVTVQATVTDAKGRLVDGLGEGNFIVVDNGRGHRVQVDTIGTGVAPIALMVVVQSSGISAAVLEKVKRRSG